MKNTGLFGYPVKHSLSPFMHNIAFENVGLENESYTLYEVIPGELEEKIHIISKDNLRGVNVTIPHKEKVIPFLQELTDEAKNIGAVNTVINKEGVLVGDNTDGKGFITSLKEQSDLKFKGSNVLICGAGGAARAIIYSLLKEGINKLYISDIYINKATELKEYFNSVAFGYSVNIEIISTVDIHSGCMLNDDIEKKFKDLNLFINASPCGMQEDDVSVPLDERFIKDDLFIYDIVYNRETQLIKLAKQKGLKYLDGSWMLVYQGALAFEAWTGKKAPVELMHDTLMKKLIM